MKREFIPFLLAMVMLVFACSESATTDPEPSVEPEPPVTEEPKYKPGDYYKSGIAEGIVAYVDESGEHGLIISVDEGMTQWSTDYIMLVVQGGEFSREDGARNTAYIKQQENWEEIYPAVAWCDSKNALGLSSWYLPAPNELAKAAANIEVINATLAEKGFETIATGVNDGYWSSEEYGVQGAYAMSFATGDFADYGHDKKAINRVRAMRKI